MSESLSDNWGVDPNEPIVRHHEQLMNGIELIHNRLVLPDDKRHDIGYIRMSGGGSLIVLSDPGVGKTTYLDAVLGHENITNVRKQLTHADLFGGQHVFDYDKWSEAALQGLANGKQIVYLNELPHLPDTGDIHYLWDPGQKTVKISGKEVDITNITIAATGNFADGNRCIRLGNAILSRLAYMIIEGDKPREKMKVINQRGHEMKSNTDRLPVLPPPEIRAVLRKHMDHYRPMIRDDDYIQELIINLMKSRLTGYISTNDARIGDGMRHTAAADMFMREEDKNLIQPLHYARIAALAMPALVSLSNHAKSKLISAKEEKTGNSKLEDIEIEIAKRRVIANFAFRTLMSISNDEKLSPKGQKKLDKFMTDHAYANPSVLNEINEFNMDEVLFS